MGQALSEMFHGLYHIVTYLHNNFTILQKFVIKEVMQRSQSDTAGKLENHI